MATTGDGFVILSEAEQQRRARWAAARAHRDAKVALQDAKEGFPDELERQLSGIGKLLGGDLDDLAARLAAFD